MGFLEKNNSKILFCSFDDELFQFIHQNFIGVAPPTLSSNQQSKFFFTKNQLLDSNKNPVPFAVLIFPNIHLQIFCTSSGESNYEKDIQSLTL